MIRRPIVVAILLNCMCLGASDIRLPMRGVVVTPEPVPEIVAEPVDTIGIEEWFIVESDTQLICLTSPPGVIDVESLAGPMTFRGRFAGGDKVETRTFASQYLYAVTALVGGKAELIAVPVGVASEDNIKRVMLTVTGPRPPPDPDPQPDPPDPEPQPNVKHVRISVITDLDNMPQSVATVLNALVGWNELFDSGSDYRLYDIQTTERSGKTAIEQLNGPAPGIVFTDKDTGAVLHKGPLPEKFSDLKKLKGDLTGD